MAWHFVENLAALVEQALAPQQTDHNRVDMFVWLAPDLALHVLEETKRPLPVASVREFFEHQSEVVQQELVLEDFEATRNTTARREATQLID